MSYTFRLPDIGEGLEEAEIIAWLVHPGDVVERDQPLVEVLTDKANSELPSPVSGKILRLGAAEGERLSVGEVLVELDDGSDSDTSDNTPRTEPDDLNHSAVTAVKKRIKAAPATRKLALDLGVEIENVTGTGPGGRITQSDIHSASEVTANSQKASNETQENSSDTENLGQIEFGKHPLNGIRGVIARNMNKSWSEIPHIHTLDEIDASLLVDLRNRLKSTNRKGASFITPLTFAAASAIRALQRYPMVNAFVESDPEESFVVHEEINLGIATATNDGLVVPVIHGTQKMDFFSLALNISNLVSRARKGNLEVSDLSGGTFTITNYGALGGRWAFPIIPHGQAAILGLGKIVERPLVVNGSVEARLTLPIVLGADHRIIDGDLIEAFKQSIMKDLSDPLDLALEG